VDPAPPNALRSYNSGSVVWGGLAADNNKDDHDYDPSKKFQAIDIRDLKNGISEKERKAKMKVLLDAIEALKAAPSKSPTKRKKSAPSTPLASPTKRNKATPRGKGKSASKKKPENPVVPRETRPRRKCRAALVEDALPFDDDDPDRSVFEAAAESDKDSEDVSPKKRRRNAE
jgi:hypothetical protein